MYALILAGGSGTRLWPYSRSERPKQFLSISSARTMLQETADRILPLVAPDRIYIATGAAYAAIVAEQLPDVPRENILIEPCGRGTAPCIGLAALHMLRRDPNAVMAVLSADHRIVRAELFCDILQAGEQLAQQNSLVTIGIAPTEPSTGYGYIKQGAALPQQHGHAAYQVAGFVEKPDAAHAEAYVASGEYVWNAGMFVWRADHILAEINQHRPALAEPLATINAALGNPNAQDVVNDVWPGMDNVAIDVAVMEQTAHAAVLPADLGWSDVGDWAALADTLPQDADGNAVLGQHVGLDTHDTLIYGNGRVIATIGLEDFLVIDTHDVLLICPRDRAQDVKALVAQVRKNHTPLT